MKKKKKKRNKSESLLYTSLFRAGVEWLTSVIASLLIKPSDRMPYSSFPEQRDQLCLFIHPRERPSDSRILIKIN